MSSGGGVFSFIHVDDAAAATVRAVTVGSPGLYNVVDDDPAPLREWLPRFAAVLGAPRPRRVPRFLARLAAGPYGVYLMTGQRGAANGKAKRKLQWDLLHPSWRDALGTAQ